MPKAILKKKKIVIADTPPADIATLSTLGGHFWFAAGIACLAVILSGVIAFTSVNAASKHTPSTDMLSQPATKADIQRVMQRIDRLEKSLKGEVTDAPSTETQTATQ